MSYIDSYEKLVTSSNSRRMIWRFFYEARINSPTQRMVVAEEGKKRKLLKRPPVAFQAVWKIDPPGIETLSSLYT